MKRSSTTGGGLAGSKFSLSAEGAGVASAGDAGPGATPGGLFFGEGRDVKALAFGMSGCESGVTAGVPEAEPVPAGDVPGAGAGDEFEATDL